MTLVDTSVWVDYRRGDPRTLPLADLLDGNEVVVHPFVQGELALSGLGPSTNLVSLAALPTIPMVPHAEVVTLVTRRLLRGTGIGWLDAHLVASALASGATLWTHDRRLETVAIRVGIAHEAVPPTTGC